MDEMTLLRSLRADIRAAHVTREAEEAFISRITAEAADPPPEPRPGPARAGLRRLPTALRGNVRGWRLAVAGGVSLALAAGLIAGVAFGPGRSSPASQPTPAVLLAERAAASAAKQQPVSPGQWVYTQSVVGTSTPPIVGHICAVKTSDGQVRDIPLPVPGARAGVTCTVMMSPGGGTTVYSSGGGSGSNQRPAATGKGTVVEKTYPAVNSLQQQERWSTADGTRQASYSASGRLAISAACQCGLVSYADLGKLPSDPRALVRWAMRPPGGGGHYTTADLAWNAFNGIEGTLTSYVVPPKVAAVLYRALGDIPGVTVDNDAVDAAGRHGPAFVLTDKDYPGGGWTAEIFLNPRTFQLTGYAEHFPEGCQCPGRGTGATAILQQVLVSGPGVRP